MPVNAEISGGIARITLARPARANALDRGMVRGLRSAARMIEAGGARAAILCGEGANFCGGADLAEMRESSKPGSGGMRLAATLQSLWLLPAPLIAAVRGACYGGGAGLAAVADIALAAPSAKFCFSEVRLGLAPAVISPYVVNAMGARHAARLFASAEAFGAEEAARIGLIHEVVGEDDLMTRAEDLARRMADHGPQAMRAAKQLARSPVPRRRVIELAHMLEHLASGEEAQERIAAFLDRSR